MTSAAATYTPNSTAPVPALRSSIISFWVLKLVQHQLVDQQCVRG